jgi:uncharacterized FAD-dependent dehydrogenase
VIQHLQITVLPQIAFDATAIEKIVAGKIAVSSSDSLQIVVQKRSIDARRKPVKYLLQIAAYINEKAPSFQKSFHQKKVQNAQKIHIVGAGSAGLFAALRAIELGFKPVIFERGKTVRERRRDLAKINKEHTVNPESNYCFGEGGAGTYSDGKLYTRSKKRGDVEKVLNLLIEFGAPEDIAVDAHPHIGTNQLPKIIEQIRETILICGGEIHFEHKLTDIFIENEKINGIEINHSQKINVQQLVLATGHSARDIFYLLHRKGVKINAKPFAIGVRAEHPQTLINDIQYHCDTNIEMLPPASYALVEQVDGMGVYSFCMCPGGIVAPCASQPEEVVTNGWSPSKRNNPFANSGIVVQIKPEDLPGDANDPLICLRFQEEVEKKCWEAAGKSQKVPAQRMIDFCQNKLSENLPKSSYIPGIHSVNLHNVLPAIIAQRLQKAFVRFGQKMKGYYTNEAVLHAPESRTSSPIQIPRDKETMEHIHIKGLYPCAEGAGYAGGIVSAAIDGMNCVEKIAMCFGETLKEK